MFTANSIFDNDLARELPLSIHAVNRSIERRVPLSQIDLILRHGDLKFPARNGCVEHQISHQAAMQLRRRGIGPRNISLLTSLVVIVAESGPIVTVFRR
jgi:hypothetical protein